MSADKPHSHALLCEDDDRRERARRARILARCDFDMEFRAAVMAKSARDCAWWFNNFAWTFDPRVLPERKPTMPFVLWDRQAEFLGWVHARIVRREQFVVEKSRDVGASYLMAAYAVWAWLFVPGFKTTFGSYKREKVDKIGDPDSLFEKIRTMLRAIPDWMMPAGFSWDQHVVSMQIRHPTGGATISGDCGPNMGRGGRSTLYIVDEGAHLANASAVDAATTANTDVVGWVSSVYGQGGVFADKARSGKFPVFRFHYSDDPRKTGEWVEKKRATTDPVVWAQEYEIDYGASVEGIAIPLRWIDAARELRKRFPNYKTAVAGRAGLDVGGGKAESVCFTRHGPLISMPKTWRESDTIEVAHAAFEYVQRQGCGLLNFDAPGVGAGVAAVFQRLVSSAVSIWGINTGEPPSVDVWPDGRTARQKFFNCKAELWEKARERFKRSYELLRHLDGFEDDAHPHDIEDCIMMVDDEETCRQLNTPKRLRREDGKWMIERKEQLASRGVKSPDRADAFVLMFYEPPVASIYVGG